MKKLLATIIITFFLIPRVTFAALTVTPNDPHFNQQQYISHIHANEAWGYTVGSSEVVIAVVDSGVDTDHPDLLNNLWKNKNETPGNNLDDDHNGYIDDVAGWNFVEKNNDPNPVFVNYTTEGVSHGTLIAGIIAAVGDNAEGLTGIAWNAKIMPLRALNSQGAGKLEDAALAIRYATDNGAHIINLSFVGTSPSDEFRDAVRYAYQKGLLLVAAVGNDATGTATATGSGGNLDEVPIYPACFADAMHDYVIGVGAVDKENKKASFSNFGKTCLDMNAPGTDIVSTQVYDQEKGTPFTAKYTGLWEGTSFAAPQIAGVAALIKSLNKEYTNKDIAETLFATADSIDAANPGFSGLLGRGLLNARRALRATAPATFVPFDPREQLMLQRENKGLWVTDDTPLMVEAASPFLITASFKNKSSLSWLQPYISLSVTDWNGNPIDFKPHPPSLNNAPDIIPTQTLQWKQLLNAPEKSGKYSLRVQLVYKSVPVTGATFYKQIEITPRQSGSIVKLTIPLAVRSAWGSAPVTIVVRNNTDKPWEGKNISLLISSTGGLTLMGIGAPREVIISPQGTATFEGRFNFANSPRGKHYYSIMLKMDGTTSELEGGEKIIRID